jgi:hypothetical protein
MKSALFKISSLSLTCSQATSFEIWLWFWFSVKQNRVLWQDILIITLGYLTSRRQLGIHCQASGVWICYGKFVKVWRSSQDLPIVIGPKLCEACADKEEDILWGLGCIASLNEYVESRQWLELQETNRSLHSIYLFIVPIIFCSYVVLACSTINLLET